MTSDSGRPLALVIGATGQDGHYLVRHLKAAGCRVIGTTRRTDAPEVDGISCIACDITRATDVATLIASTKPDEIYNLAGETSVGRSIANPAATLESIAQGTLNILEAARHQSPKSRIFLAGSGEVFGGTQKDGATEDTPFRPHSPYGIAKAAAASLIGFYREAYGLFACTAFLFNHESPLRPADFVTMKIVRGAIDIATGRSDRLSLGRLDVSRDWGWAPEYVEAFRLMLMQETPEDFVIATGKAHTLQNFVEIVFTKLGLDWQAHVVSDPALHRATDTTYNCGNPAKAARMLGWRATRDLEGVIDGLIEAARERR